MRRLLPALLLLLPLLAPPAAVSAADDDGPLPVEPIGVWRGELEPGEGARGAPLKIVLRIRQGKGGIAATIDGLGRNLRDLKVENLIVVEDVLSFQVSQVEGRFAGNFYGDSLRGTWSQGEASRPLILFRD